MAENLTVAVALGDRQRRHLAWLAERLGLEAHLAVHGGGVFERRFACLGSGPLRRICRSLELHGWYVIYHRLGARWGGCNYPVRRR